MLIWLCAVFRQPATSPAAFAPLRGPQTVRGNMGAMCGASNAAPLILGGVWNGYALHASDRQVSKRKKPSSPYEAHDLHSNKTIVIVARRLLPG